MRKLVYLSVFVLILFGLHDVSLAQDAPLAQPRSYQPIGTTGVFSVFSAKTLKKGQIAVGIALDFAEGIGPYDDDHHPDQKTLALQLGYGLTERFDIGLDLPFTWWYPDTFAWKGERVGFHEQGLDDLSIGLRYRLLDEKEAAPGIAILGAATFPTGDENKGLSTGGTDYDAKLILSKRIGPVNSHFNIGYSWPGTQKYDLEEGITYGVGIDFSASSQVQLLAELIGNKNRFTQGLNPEAHNDPLEWKLGLRFISDTGIIATLGTGFGCLSPATPDYRIIAGLTYTYPPEARRVIKVKEPEVAPAPEVKPEVRPEAVPQEELYKIVLEDVHFEFDKSTLTTLAKEILNENAKRLKENLGIKVIIEGHCDERGSREYNLALGERRAVSVKNYLSSLGIEDKRMKTISYGEERPLDPGHNERAWALNRRAHFVIEVE
jgi:peptidoglycan-associated lipoprotein